MINFIVQFMQILNAVLLKLKLLFVKVFKERKIYKKYIPVYNNKIQTIFFRIILIKPFTARLTWHRTVQ